VRPVYENEGNLADERLIADAVAKAWDCTVVKLPRAYNLDYAILRHKELVAWCEIKRRFRTLEQYPNTFLSMQKVFAAHNFHNVSEKPCFFIVGFDDHLAYADMLPKRSIEFRGRTDRGDWQDVEPVATVPTADFKIIRVAVAEPV